MAHPLNQAQNEALVKLMMAARYQDKKLSLKEEEALQRQLKLLHWTASTDINAFVMRQIAPVRRSIENAASLKNFIAAQCAYFHTEEVKAYCLKSLTSILQADTAKEQNSNEHHFLEKIEAVLQPHEATT